MLKIGLTGGIGSGKSVVAQILKVLHVPVYDADSSAKRLMNENSELKHRIIQHFGPDCYNGNTLNRSYLASIVFADQNKLHLLNKIVHPVTIADAVAWFNLQHAPYAVKEAALLFESGSAEGLDYVIGVTAPRALRIRRVMQRDRIHEEQVTERMRHQLDEGIKMKLCDFIIHNDEQQLVIPQVMEIHRQLMTLSQPEKNHS
jgi:dephospho-CoA kinase